jgi:hypothetical protein
MDGIAPMRIAPQNAYSASRPSACAMTTTSRAPTPSARRPLAHASAAARNARRETVSASAPGLT